MKRLWGIALVSFVHLLIQYFSSIARQFFTTPNPYTFSDSLGVSIAIYDLLSSYISVLSDFSLITIFIVQEELIVIILKIQELSPTVREIALLRL